MITLLYLLASKALAVNISGIGINDAGGMTTSSGVEGNISTLASSVVNVITLLVGIAAVIYLLWSGLQYITSAGNAEKTKVARAGIINAVIGIIIVVATYSIIRFAISAGNTVSDSSTGSGNSGTTTNGNTGGSTLDPMTDIRGVPANGDCYSDSNCATGLVCEGRTSTTYGGCKYPNSSGGENTIGKASGQPCDPDHPDECATKQCINRDQDNSGVFVCL